MIKKRVADLFTPRKTMLSLRRRPRLLLQGALLTT